MDGCQRASHGGKVYADAAYRDTKRRKKLEGRGVFYCVMHKRVCVDKVN